MQVSDYQSPPETATKALSLTVVATPLQITTASLPSAWQNVTYGAMLTAVGGQMPYTWSIACGSLPAGLTLSSSGQISGTPTTQGTSSFTVRVTDGVNAHVDKALGIFVGPTPVRQHILRRQQRP